MWNSSQNSFCIGRSAIQREFARLQSRGGSRYKVHEEGMGRPLDENWGISQGRRKESGGSGDTSDISVRDFDLFRGSPPKKEVDAGMQGKSGKWERSRGLHLLKVLLLLPVGADDVASHLLQPHAEMSL